MLHSALTLFALTLFALTTGSSLSLRIIHTNDIHAHYSEFNKFGGDCTQADIAANACYGGAARLATIVGQLRSGHPNSLLFDAGDQAQGTLFYTMGKFNTTIKVMNQLGYDAMCLGNHEFDDGPDLLATFAQQLRFPVICANLDASSNVELNTAVKPYVVIDKYKLGVIGYITTTTGSTSNAGSVAFSDAAAAVNKYVDQLQQRGIRHIIAVSHNGYLEDMGVAAQTRGLGLIVGGHSHTYLSANASEPGTGGVYPTAVRNRDGQLTYVVQAKAWGEYVGFVDIEFADSGAVAKISGQPIHLTQDVADDPGMAAQVREWRRPFAAYGERVVGRFAASTSHEQCKARECALGDTIADAMLWAGRRNNSTRADIAIINGGGIRAGIRAGAVRVKDVLLTFPFTNSLVALELSGHQLHDVIAGVLAKRNAVNGRPISSFIQIAGARVRYHRDESDGVHIEAIDMALDGGWAPLDSEKTYVVVTLDYIARGGDNIIAPASDPPALKTLDVVFEEYLSAFSPIAPNLANRIVETGLQTG